MKSNLFPVLGFFNFCPQKTWVWIYKKPRSRSGFNELDIHTGTVLFRKLLFQKRVTDYYRYNWYPYRTLLNFRYDFLKPDTKNCFSPGFLFTVVDGCFCVPNVGEVFHEVVEGGAGQQSLQNSVHETPVRPEERGNFSSIYLTNGNSIFATRRLKKCCNSSLHTKLNK